MHMVKFVLLFKTASNTGTFRMQYSSNLALLRKMPGVTRIQESTVLGSPAGLAPYHRILEIHFADQSALDAALDSPEGVTAGKDLIAYAGTNVELLFVETDNPSVRQPLLPDDLQAYLKEHQIAAEIVYPGKPTPTVPAAAEALGVSPDQIVKSVLFVVNDQPFLVYGCGEHRVDPRKLAERLNESRKSVKLANADQVLDFTGYAVGTVPPVGLKTHMPAFMDPAIQTHEVIYAGGGGIDALLKMTSAELLRASRAEVAPMLRDAGPPAASPAANTEPETNNA